MTSGRKMFSVFHRNCIFLMCDMTGSSTICMSGPTIHSRNWTSSPVLYRINHHPNSLMYTHVIVGSIDYPKNSNQGNRDFKFKWTVLNHQYKNESRYTDQHCIISITINYCGYWCKDSDNCRYFCFIQYSCHYRMLPYWYLIKIIDHGSVNLMSQFPVLTRLHTFSLYYTPDHRYLAWLHHSSLFVVI